MKPKADPTAMRVASAAKLARDVAAYEAMRASRPLKPPPMRLLPPVVTAAQLELRQARKLGLAA